MRLQLTNVRKRFGGLVAIDGCSLSCEPATLSGLVGPNGSGKSTLFNIIGGIVAPDAGEVRLGEQRLTGLLPHRTARAGIGRTFQTTRLFKSLSVLENVLLGASSMGERKSHVDEARTLLDRFGIAGLAAREAEALSFGQQRLVELARAMIGKPAFHPSRRAVCRALAADGSRIGAACGGTCRCRHRRHAHRAQSFGRDAAMPAHHGPAPGQTDCRGLGGRGVPRPVGDRRVSGRT